MAFVAPALDGRDPLGFLAALGTLRLLSVHVDRSANLGFDRVSGQARLSADTIPDLDSCIVAIQSIVDGMGESVVPGMPADFPPPGAAPDGLRVAPAQLGEMADRWTEQADDPETVYRWVRALVTDLAMDRTGRAAITPFAAPSGKQSFSTMFVGAKDALLDRPTAFREAFLGWRRVPGYTGEYLDHRVLMSGADAPTKVDARERGVPGATWLALMALPSMPATARNGTRTAVGWHLARAQREWRWPLWDRPCGLRAVEVLLNHPAVERVADERPRTDDESHAGGRRTDAEQPDAQRRALRRLGIFLVCAASRSRIPGRKSDGVLVPRRVISVNDEN